MTKVQPKTLAPYGVGLVLALLLDIFVPLEAFLGMPRVPQVVLAAGVVVLPISFAGVVSAVSFSRTSEPDRAFGANVAGAMLGGLAEYTSMRLGFQNVGYVAIAFYALALLAGYLGERRAASTSTEPEGARAAPAA